jgi:MoaA/NifB/PqqE/SkfB family radical SAM enzyme
MNYIKVKFKLNKMIKKIIILALYKKKKIKFKKWMNKIIYLNHKYFLVQIIKVIHLRITNNLERYLKTINKNSILVIHFMKLSSVKKIKVFIK